MRRDEAHGKRELVYTYTRLVSRIFLFLRGITPWRRYDRTTFPELHDTYSQVYFNYLLNYEF